MHEIKVDNNASLKEIFGALMTKKEKAMENELEKVSDIIMREEQLDMKRDFSVMKAKELVRFILDVRPGERSSNQKIADNIATRLECSGTFDIVNGDLDMVKAIWELAARFAGKKVKIYLKPRDVLENLAEIRNAKKEHFVVFFLDTRNQEIKRDIISIGTLNYNLVHPREVFEPAVKHLAAGIILAHNHPSGSLEPSDEDLSLTKRLAQAGKLLGIEVLDHVIVSKQGYMSFKEKGLI